MDKEELVKRLDGLSDFAVNSLDAMVTETISATLALLWISGVAASVLFIVGLIGVYKGNRSSYGNDSGWFIVAIFALTGCAGFTAAFCCNVHTYYTPLSTTINIVLN